MANTHTQTQTDDQRLIERLRGAVAARVAAESLEGYVGKRPLINTTSGSSLAALRRVDFLPDPEHSGDPFDRGTANVVIYWARPIPAPDPHVVGVQYQKDGTPALFFAIIPPP